VSVIVGPGYCNVIVGLVAGPGYCGTAISVAVGVGCSGVLVALAVAIWVWFGVTVTNRFGFVVGELTPVVGEAVCVCGAG
jgi:hypothetical protein